MSEESINAIIQEINKLNALPNIEETNFNNGYRKALYDSCYLYQNLIKEKERLKWHILMIKEAIETWNIKYREGTADFEIPQEITSVVWSDKE